MRRRFKFFFLSKKIAQKIFLFQPFSINNTRPHLSSHLITYFPIYLNIALSLPPLPLSLFELLETHQFTNTSTFHYLIIKHTSLSLSRLSIILLNHLTCTYKSE